MFILRATSAPGGKMSTHDELCHIISRLADTVEAMVRETTGDEVTLRRLDNIRHDTLKLMVKARG